MDKNDKIIKEIEENQEDILLNIDFESVAVYSFIKNEYARGNIRSNFVFQFVFRSYYRLDNAGLSNEMKRHFFELLAEKETNLEVILSELYEIPDSKGKKTIQFSFATKLLHTIDNDKPIFDSKVANVTNMRQKGSDKDSRIHSCIEIYDSLEKLYSDFRKNYKIRKLISEFRSKFEVDDEKISDAKALDFIMWSLGKLKEK